MNDFKGQIAVITGAANGLGKALAIELHRCGCDLALLDVDETGLKQLLAELAGSTRQISIHTVDVSKEDQVSQARTDILAIHGKADILVNNAGVSISQPFGQMSLQDYKWLFDINFWGTVHCTKMLLPDLLKSPDGRLVNIISDFALMGFPAKTAYASSKSAVMGFTNALKTELAGTSLKACLVIPPALFTGIVASGKHIDGEKREKEAGFLKKHGMPLPKAAQKIIQGVQKGQYRIIIGSMMFWLDLLSRLSPTLLHDTIGRYKKRIDFI
jgi:short-subunit dehydrogenase